MLSPSCVWQAVVNEADAPTPPGVCEACENLGLLQVAFGSSIAHISLDVYPMFIQDFLLYWLILVG